MEEYKKKYEETEERAKNIYNSDPYNSIVRAVCEQIFPELKESEDLKIKRDIQYAVRCAYGDNSNNTNSIFAWLEKHTEQKPTAKIQLGKKYKCIASPRYSTFMIGRVYKPEDKFLCSLMNFCSDCFELIEDGEQKTTDKVEPKFKIGDKIIEKDLGECNCGIIVNIKDGKYIFADGYYMNIDEQDGWQLVKTPTIIGQKPAWSEEDESKFKFLHHLLEQNLELHGSYGFSDIKELGYVTKQEALDMLKSIKERVQPQPKQEWSEEDEKIFRSLSKALARISSNTRTDSTSINYSFFIEIEWLKSLKERMKGE